jgi:hypothetical protein
MAPARFQQIFVDMDGKINNKNQDIKRPDWRGACEGSAPGRLAQMWNCIVDCSWNVAGSFEAQNR